MVFPHDKFEQIRLRLLQIKDGIRIIRSNMAANEFTQLFSFFFFFLRIIEGDNWLLLFIASQTYAAVYTKLEY